MANKTILDFPLVTDFQKDDVAYLIRGVGAGRDKHTDGFAFYEQMMAQSAYVWYQKGGTQLLSGGFVQQGVGDTLDIEAALGVSFDTLPRAVLSNAQDDLALGSATLDGSTVNYVKLQYAESSRDFAFAFVVDSVTPTDADIVLASFVGSSGQTFTITNRYPIGETQGIAGEALAVNDPVGWMGNQLRKSQVTELDSIFETDTFGSSPVNQSLTVDSDGRIVFIYREGTTSTDVHVDYYEVDEDGQLTKLTTGGPGVVDTNTPNSIGVVPLSNGRTLCWNTDNVRVIEYDGAGGVTMVTGITAHTVAAVNGTSPVAVAPHTADRFIIGGANGVNGPTARVGTLSGASIVWNSALTNMYDTAEQATGTSFAPYPNEANGDDCWIMTYGVVDKHVATLVAYDGTVIRSPVTLASSNVNRTTVAQDAGEFDFPDVLLPFGDGFIIALGNHIFILEVARAQVDDTRWVTAGVSLRDPMVVTYSTLESLTVDGAAISFIGGAALVNGWLFKGITWNDGAPGTRYWAPSIVKPRAVDQFRVAMALSVTDSIGGGVASFTSNIVVNVRRGMVAGLRNDTSRETQLYTAALPKPIGVVKTAVGDGSIATVLTVGQIVGGFSGLVPGTVYGSIYNDGTIQEEGHERLGVAVSETQMALTL